MLTIAKLQLLSDVNEVKISKNPPRLKIDNHTDAVDTYGAQHQFNWNTTRADDYIFMTNFNQMNEKTDHKYFHSPSFVNES